MDDLTLAARLAEKEDLEKRFVQNTMQRLNPRSEENKVVANERQRVKGKQIAAQTNSTRPGIVGRLKNLGARQEAGRQARSAYRTSQALTDQASLVGGEGSAAMRNFNVRAPKQSTDVSRTARQNQKTVDAYQPELEQPTMVDDGTAAPAAAPAAQAAPQGPDAQGNMPLPPGQTQGQQPQGQQPQGQQAQGQMPGMDMGNILGAARMFADQGLAQQQMRLQQQNTRQNDPAYKAQVADANRRANKRGGLLNAATFGLSGAIGRAGGRRDLRNLRASTMKSADRVGLENLLLAKSAVRERDGTDRLRGLK